MKKSRLTFLAIIIAALVPLAVNCVPHPNNDDKEDKKELASGIPIDKKNFPDDNFRTYLLEQDFGKDSILTVKEQKKVNRLMVRATGIRTLQGIEHFPYLRDLRMSDQILGQLTLPQMEELYRLYCMDCQLTGLDVSQCPNLVELKCNQNKLTKLDLSRLPKLEMLYANENQLSEIILEGTDSLSFIDVRQNQLTKFNLSTQRNLHCVFIGDNPMDEKLLDSFLSQLPIGVKLDTSWSDHIEFEEPYISLGNRTITDPQKQMIAKKGWRRHYSEK